MRTDYRSLYVAFDPHPSYKGASTHIHHVIKTLSEAFSPMLLLTLKSNLDPVETPNIEHLRFETEETNILKRTTEFTHWVKSIISLQHNLLIGHFRDCWSGLAFKEFPHVHTLFEVNGFPSIELPYRFPDIAKETLQKIERAENYCLHNASAIITPSSTTKYCIEKRSVNASKIIVIPNGAEIPSPSLRDKELPKNYMVYVGALQPWQGVDVLLKSLRYLEDVDIPLVICSSYADHQAKPYRKFAEKLGVNNRVIWLHQLPKPRLNQIMQHALFSVAPLTECSRNIEQGCSPLKILESMACGTPVIASRLPAVMEIISHNEDGVLCRPDRPADLARAIRIAMDYPENTARMGQQALTKVKDHFTWQMANQSLRNVYDTLFTFSF
ncbi:MAG: glycosyltransferase [Cyclobacteriaceae bacterium]|nr:glycosyltransferase [Cyclobacteriaceae bacterium]